MDQLSLYRRFFQPDPSPMMLRTPYLRPYPGKIVLSQPLLPDNVRASPSAHLIRHRELVVKGKLSLCTSTYSLLVVDERDSPTTV